jgi:hypothetical protein
LNNVEGIGVFALSRTSTDDDFLNRLITGICKEIAYPLITPVISQMSQDYFHIYPDFNLLCLPPMESRFLLHLPDIYHELCHPLHRNFDVPRLEPYEKAYKQSLFGMVRHYQIEIDAADRLRNQEGRLFQLQLWRNCWVKYWMEEFFCDLFGLLAVGPAFAWSHYHLCIKRGGDPFHTPLMFETTHPADDARMRAFFRCYGRTARFERTLRLSRRVGKSFARRWDINLLQSTFSAILTYWFLLSSHTRGMGLKESGFKSLEQINALPFARFSTKRGLPSGMIHPHIRLGK